MPTYSYRCRECDKAFDIQQGFTDDTLTVCPNCGGVLRKIFSPIGVSFTGSGFYRNDSRAKPATEKADAGKAESGKADSGKSESGKSESGKSSTDKGGSTKDGASSTPTPTPAKNQNSSTSGGKSAATTSKAAAK